MRFRSVLVLCPLKVVPAWAKQAGLHAGAPLSVVALNKGTVEKKTATARKAMEVSDATGQPTVIVINYESAWQGAFPKWALARRWDCVILDESHKIKAPGGVTSEFCDRLGKKADYRLCLTGTPMPHGPLDVYAQYRFLDPGIFGTSFIAFRSHYAVMGGFEGKEIVNYQHEDELNERFYRIAYRVGKEVLDLPAQHHIDVPCELGAEAQRIYRKLEHGFIAEVKSGKVTISNALVRLLRLQQITSGYVTDDDGAQQHVDSEKEKALADTLDGLQPDDPITGIKAEPVVVFCRFTHDLDAVKRVAEAGGRIYHELSGRVNDLAAWQRGDGSVLGVQIQAGGVGIDLTRACYAVYYSVGYNMGEYEQSLSRVHRPGQERPVTYYHLVATGTVDEVVYATLATRKNIVEAVLAKLLGSTVAPGTAAVLALEAERIG